MTGTPDGSPGSGPHLAEDRVRSRVVGPAPTTAETARQRVEEAFAAAPGSTEAAVTVPTSGSTGEPRRVRLSATALRASGEATASRLGGHGQWLLALPTGHVAGLQVVARSVLAGTVPVTWDLAAGFRSADFAAAAARMTGRRRFTSLVPTQAHRILDDARAARPAGAEALCALTTFDAVLLGGAASSPALLDGLREAGVRVVTTYGMSETSGGCVYDGRPLDGVRLRLSGTPGAHRIEITGPVLADCYLDDPEATAEAFVTDDSARWFRTSDLGALSPDGVLSVLGRADDVLVTGGVNVAPAAVEALLAGWGGIAQACVVGQPDETWGAEVVAVVTLRGHSRPAEEELLALVREHVADTLGAPAAPRRLVVLDELPLRGPGKVDRRAAAALAARRLGRPTFDY